MMQFHPYSTLNPVVKGSGGYCFGTFMYLDALSMKWMAEYMAIDIHKRTDDPRSASYLPPGVEDGPRGEANYWWTQVQFLHGLTLLHTQSKILGWGDERSVAEGSVERRVARALYLAKWWKEKSINVDQVAKGQPHWGSQTGWAKFDPVEFLDKKWADCFTRPEHLELQEVTTPEAPEYHDRG